MSIISRSPAGVEIDIGTNGIKISGGNMSDGEISGGGMRLGARAGSRKRTAQKQGRIVVSP